MLKDFSVISAEKESHMTTVSVMGILNCHDGLLLPIQNLSTNVSFEFKIHLRDTKAELTL